MRALEMGRAPRFWQNVFDAVLPRIRAAIPPGSHVLEVGYGDGVLSSWLAATLGWRLTGLDVHTASKLSADGAAQDYGVTERTEFLVMAPDRTREFRGIYDAVFIKTVLYSSPTLEEYERWLDWVHGALRPGGMFVNFETGRGNGLVQLYRRWRGREYADQCLYAPAIERLYDERFEIVAREYFGGLSQFLAVMPGVYEAATALESMLLSRSAANCFATAIIARRPFQDEQP